MKKKDRYRVKNFELFRQEKQKKAQDPYYMPLEVKEKLALICEGCITRAKYDIAKSSQDTNEYKCQFCKKDKENKFKMNKKILGEEIFDMIVSYQALICKKCFLDKIKVTIKCCEYNCKENEKEAFILLNKQEIPWKCEPHRNF